MMPATCCRVILHLIQVTPIFPTSSKSVHDQYLGSQRAGSPDVAHRASILHSGVLIFVRCCSYLITCVVVKFPAIGSFITQCLALSMNLKTRLISTRWISQEAWKRRARGFYISVEEGRPSQSQGNLAVTSVHTLQLCFALSCFQSNTPLISRTDHPMLKCRCLESWIEI